MSKTSGVYLRELRCARRLSQLELANLLSAVTGTVVLGSRIDQWERGETVPLDDAPADDLLLWYAVVLDLPLVVVLKRRPPASPYPLGPLNLSRPGLLRNLWRTVARWKVRHGCPGRLSAAHVDELRAIVRQALPDLMAWSSCEY